MAFDYAQSQHHVQNVKHKEWGEKRMVNKRGFSDINVLQIIQGIAMMVIGYIVISTIFSISDENSINVVKCVCNCNNSVIKLNWRQDENKNW